MTYEISHTFLSFVLLIRVLIGKGNEKFDNTLQIDDFFIKNYHFVLNFSFYQIFTLSSGFT